MGNGGRTLLTAIRKNLLWCWRQVRDNGEWWDYTANCNYIQFDMALLTGERGWEMVG
jgi:hypothetical protein